MGKLVMVAGLDATFQRRPFDAMIQLVPLAESVVKLTAVCVGCRQPASFTFRKDAGSHAVEVLTWQALNCGLAGCCQAHMNSALSCASWLSAHTEPRLPCRTWEALTSTARCAEPATQRPRRRKLPLSSTHPLQHPQTRAAPPAATNCECLPAAASHLLVPCK